MVHKESPWENSEKRNVISKDFIDVTLPFAGATDEKVWWLATIHDKVYQVEVSGLKTTGLKLPVWKIEEMFANTEARVSVPVV